MSYISSRFHKVVATVDEVLPVSGLAFATDEHHVSWTVTRSTPGIGLASLIPGQRLDLTVEDHDSFSVVSGYAPLD